MAYCLNKEIVVSFVKELLLYDVSLMLLKNYRNYDLHRITQKFFLKNCRNAEQVNGVEVIWLQSKAEWRTRCFCFLLLN